MAAVTDIVFKKNGIEVDDDIISDVTLQNNLVRKRAIEINFNTGATTTRVLYEKGAVSKETNNSGTTNLGVKDDDKVQPKRTRCPEVVEESEKVKKARVSSSSKGDKTRITKPKQQNNEGDNGKTRLFKPLGNNEDAVKNQVNSEALLSSPKQFSCNECDSSFTRKFALLKHKKHKHEVVENSPPTPARSISGLETVKFADVKKESSTREVPKPFCCQHCDKTFKLGSHLKLHMKKFHPPQDPQQAEVVRKEGGIFVAIEEDEGAAKLEGQQMFEDPFLCHMREKLLQDNDVPNSDQLVTETVDDNCEEDVTNHVSVTQNVGESMNIIFAVDEALQNDFVIA